MEVQCRPVVGRLVCCCVCLLLVLLCVKMEGVGTNGRMFLLQRPTEAEVQNQLWALYLGAENEKEEMKARLDFKVSVKLSVLLSVFNVLCCIRLRS